jgi:hypothetical protein
MKASGFKDLISPEWVATWDDKDCIYLIANYGHHYLSKERMIEVQPFFL